MDTIKILIAEDHQMFRKGIAAVLNNQKGLRVLGEAVNGLEIVSMAKATDVDVILMDVHLPIMNGIVAAQMILEYDPSIKILGLSSETKEWEVLNLIKAGAKGYVLKDTTINELVMAIKALAGGNSYFSSQISEQLLLRLHSPNSSPVMARTNTKQRLTGREMEILKFITEELTNKEIAARLFISPRTVETHRRNLIQKLKVKNTVGLVKYYLESTQNQSA